METNDNAIIIEEEIPEIITVSGGVTLNSLTGGVSDGE